MSALLVKALAALVAMAAVAELAAAKNYTIQWSVSGNYGDWSSNNAVSVGDTVGEPSVLPIESFLSILYICTVSD
jgi:hypothetical protein